MLRAKPSRPLGRRSRSPGKTSIRCGTYLPIISLIRPKTRYPALRMDGYVCFQLEERLAETSPSQKIFLFEAQNVIRKNLEERLAKLLAEQSTAHIASSYGVQSLPADIVNIQHLLEIARSKCDVKTKQIMEIVAQHIGTTCVSGDQVCCMLVQ